MHQLYFYFLLFLCTWVTVSHTYWWYILYETPSYNSLIAAASLLGFFLLYYHQPMLLPGHSPLQPKLTPSQEKMSVHTSSAAFPYSSLSIALPPPTPWFYSSSHNIQPSPLTLPSYLSFISLLCFSPFFSHFPSLPLPLSLSKVLINSQYPWEVWDLHHPHLSTCCHPEHCNWPTW